jgi:hypothetical protein
MKRIVVLFALYAVSALWGQSREWKIYVISHTHADIGFTDLIPEVERVWCQGMDQAVAATEKGLKWTLEGSLLVDVYRRHRTPDKVAQLMRLAREGKIELASLYTNIEQENAAPEELVRSTFYSNQQLQREFGLESKTAILSDITGITWGLPRALAGAGTRYLLYSPGNYKELLKESTLPHLFYFKSQDGSKVLTMMRSGKYQSYSTGRMFQNAAAMEKGVPELLEYYESLGGKYPYDAILAQAAFDNTNPQVAIPENIAAWNSKHSNTRIHMATPAEFFGYIEQKYGPKIPEFSGDITSAWTDDPGIYAQATGMKRRAANEILAAEKFAVLDHWLGSNRPYPKETIDSVYRNLLIYTTDHTYGMDSWNWEHEPLAQSLGRLFSPVWDYYRESWENKKEFAYDAARAAGGMLGNTVESLASKIPSEDRGIVVFNSLSWPRTDVVQILHRRLKVGQRPYDIIDNETGRKVAYQALAGDRGGDRRYDTIAFIAKNVPALGYKTYRVVPVSTPPSFAATSVKLSGNILENEFYRVELDPGTGGVSGIFDKELQRELVDRTGTDKVNQYLYYSLTGDHEAVYQEHWGATHRGRIWRRITGSPSILHWQRALDPVRTVPR